MRERTQRYPEGITTLEGSIMILTYRKNITVDLSMAKSLVKSRLAYYNGKKYPTLADIRHVKLVTKEARDYLGKGDGVKGISAGAILAGNYFTVLIANFYLRFNKPPMPTKVFRTKEQALKWLQQFVV